jgi:hypothetical protein
VGKLGVVLRRLGSKVGTVLDPLGVKGERPGAGKLRVLPSGGVNDGGR